MPHVDVVPFLRPAAGPLQTISTVSALREDTYIVQTEYTSLPARRALSCLLEPALGDRVWVVGEDGAYFITAVLERSASAPLQLAMEGDVNLAVRNGRFNIAATKGIELATSQALGLTAGELNVKAKSGHFLVEQIHCLGQRLRAELTEIKLLGQFFDSVLERISLRVRRSYKTVEEVDMLRSEQIDFRAGKNLHLHGQNALMSAKELVKIDAEQIHLG